MPFRKGFHIGWRPGFQLEARIALKAEPRPISIGERVIYWGHYFHPRGEEAAYSHFESPKGETLRVYDREQSLGLDDFTILTPDLSSLPEKARTIAKDFFSTDPAIRATACQQMSELQCGEAVPFLFDSYFYDRTDIAYDLNSGQMKDLTCVQAEAINAFLSVRKIAHAALLSLKAPARAYLELKAQSTDPIWHSAGARHLSFELGSAYFVKDLLKLLASDKPTEICSALGQLEILGDPTYLTLVEPFATHSNWNVSRAANRTIQSLRTVVALRGQSK